MVTEQTLMDIGNLFFQADPPPQGESFETLLKQKGVVIERILSSSQIEPQEYIQVQDEWVVLLQGEALLEIAGETIRLRAGDYIFLASQTPHTVLAVSQGALCHPLLRKLRQRFPSVPSPPSASRMGGD
ncbi:cupin domain-containing protein [Synechocystis sp. LKSZ1]|uniref:cupin domain-containing protein n=1 Tax=Synechocystis sp. LKSZ1 TaxID=3144951 RepID=UPI00336BEB01